MRFEQLCPFSFELGFGPCRCGHCSGSFTRGHIEFVEDDCADLLGSRALDLHELVELFDARFDRGQFDESARARILLVFSAHAEEVLVHVPALAAILGVHHPGAAVAAPDRPAQIGVVCPVLLACGVVRVHDVLNLQPGVHIDKCFMSSLVVDAFVGHDADVVRVDQQAMERADRYRAARHFRRRTGAQSSVFERIGQICETEFTFRVLGECPAHMVGSFGVEFDPANVGAAFEAALVEVPDRRAAGGTARVELRFQSLDHFGREVVRVVAGHAALDLEVELSLRGVIDVLADGYQRRPGRLQAGIDVVVGLRAPAEPVELVHDDVRDTETVEFSEHPLELGSVDGCRGSTEFRVFGDDREVQFFGLPTAGVALKRDRVTFCASTDTGLLLGTDANIDDGTAACLTLDADRRRNDLRVLRRSMAGAELFENRLPSTGVAAGASIPPDSFWW
nr:MULTISPECIES: hypothetical protein [Rhodococcus]